MPSNAIALVVVAAGAGGGALIDLRTRRVPNVLTLGLAVAGVTGAVAGLSGLTLGASVTGLVLGFALMLPGHVIGATGAGDVKLFAAIGSLVGPITISIGFLYTVLAGGALALLVAATRGRLRLTLEHTAGLATGSRRPEHIAHPQANNRFAYAPAIAVGTLLAALGL